MPKKFRKALLQALTWCPFIYPSISVEGIDIHLKLYVVVQF